MRLLLYLDQGIGQGKVYEGIRAEKEVDVDGDVICTSRKKSRSKAPDLDPSFGDEEAEAESVGKQCEAMTTIGGGSKGIKAKERAANVTEGAQDRRSKDRKQGGFGSAQGKTDKGVRFAKPLEETGRANARQTDIDSEDSSGDFQDQVRLTRARGRAA